MTKDEITQAIRAVDVLVLTPAMLIAAANKNLHPALRIVLGIGGVSTGIYNTYNFITHLK